jgi:hypothetical protein
MSLDTLLEKYEAKDIVPNKEPSFAGVDRSEKVFDLSIQKNISTDEAGAEILVDDLSTFAKRLEDSPSYQGADELLDAYDPSEPPQGGEGIAHPLAELTKAEIAVGREVGKFALKTMAYIYSPLDRALKFVTHATMTDPLFKSAVGPVKQAVLLSVLRFEKLERLQKYRRDNNFRPNQVVPEEVRDKISQDVDVLASGLIKKVSGEVEGAEPVELGDFGRSAQDALKSLVPWPGFADDVKTKGDLEADSYGRIVGREAPWGYAIIGDTIDQTTAMVGLMKIATSARNARAGVGATQIAEGAKLTKGEVRAIKKMHKAASRVKVPVPRDPGVPSPTEAATVTQKLIKLLKEAQPLRDQKALFVHQNRQKKFAKLARVQRKVRGEKLVGATKGALTGKAAVPDFEPIATSLTGPEIDALFNLVNNSQLAAGFDKGRAVLSLDKLLKGTLITKGEIANLEAVFGKALTKTLFRKQSISSIIQDLSFEIINLPRAMMASYDLSAGLRQGIIFSVSHPKASMRAYARSIRAAASLKYADDIERVSRTTQFGKMADRFGVHSSPTGFSASLAAKEEVYMSRIAEKIPGIAQSERAFTTFLNQQRRLVFEVQAEKWIKRGITPDKNPKVFQQFAKFVNHATGRGSMETMQPGALTAMNAAFFSPRFQVSRVQVLGDLINPKTTWHARKAIARDLAEFYATGMGILAIAKMGGAEVETDPRSSDFGKIKVGETRYNYWGAFQPIATLAGRLYTGQIKSTATKKIKDKGRLNITTSFLRTKLAPVPGRTVDVGVGETILGEPVEPTKEFVAKAAYESLAPLFFQDVVDAWRFQGADAQFPISAGLAFHGIGVQTWEVAPFAKVELAKDSLARQTYGKNYDELDFVESKMLDTDILVNHPGIVELEREAKFDSQGVNYLKRQAQELRKSERFLEKNISKDLLADLHETKISLGGVDRVFGTWRLNDDQYKEYQERVARNINELFEDMRPVWDTSVTEGKYEIMTRILLSAKQLAAQEMKIGEME